MEIKPGEPEVATLLTSAEARLIEGWVTNPLAASEGQVIFRALGQKVRSAREAAEPPVQKSAEDHPPTHSERYVRLRGWLDGTAHTTPEERHSLHIVSTTLSLGELLFLRSEARACIDHHLPVIIDAQAANTKLNELGMGEKEEPDPYIREILAESKDPSIQAHVTDALYELSVAKSRVAFHILDSVNSYLQSQTPQ